MDHPVVVDRWTSALRAAVPEFLARHPVLGPLAADAAVLLHGSTAYGVDDAHSDLDLWLVLPDERLPRVDAAAGTRFFDFAHGGKPGHLNAVGRGAVMDAVRTCDLPTIAELRHAVTIVGDAEGLLALARRPMPADVRRAFATFHYVEFRGEHRAFDNPIERRDAPAVLIAMAKCVAHALQAAMVIDTEPYPYSKWLAAHAKRTPTGNVVAPLVEELIDLLVAGHLRTAGPERAHPLSLKLREVRAALDAACRAGGLDGPWLTRWWHHIDAARAGAKSARWD